MAVLQGGTAVVNVVANGAALASSISGAVQSSTARIGRSMQATGLAMTKFLTVPLVGLGAVSTKMALDFETTFARIGALAGDIGHTTEEAKVFVKDLAQATGQDPGGLAEAMYFAASAGLAAEEVFPVVKASAQAAATGMGDAALNARLLTTVLHDYEGTGLDAANAMNILTRAIKVGKAEPADFAENIGIVIPLASQLGVSFQDVAAAIAQATNAGVEASRATTGLRFLLAALQNPTEESKKKFEEFGISIQDVQNELAKSGGLLTVMQGLADTFDITTVAGREAWATITGGARGAVIANTLVGNSAESARRLWEELGESALDTSNDFEEAFEKMKQTPSFKFQQALTALKNAAIELGLVLIPILRRDVIPVIRDVIRWFQDLSDGTKSMIVRIGLLAAAFGPLLVVFGSILRMGASLVGLFTSIGGAAGAAGTAGAGAGLGALAAPLALVAGAVALLTAGYIDNAAAAKKNKEMQDELVKTLDSGKRSVDEFSAAVDTAFAERDLPEWAQDQILDNISKGYARWREEMLRLVHAVVDVQSEQGGFLRALALSGELTKKQVSTLGDFLNTMDVLGIKLRDSDKNFIKNAATSGQFKLALERLKERLQEVADRKWGVEVDTEVNTAGLDTMRNKLLGMGFRQAGGEWVASGALRIHTEPASPWPWEIIEEGLHGVGFFYRSGKWFGEAVFQLHADFANISQKLQTIVPLIREGFGVGATDQAQTFVRELRGLERQFERLKQKASDFRDAIKGAFSEFADVAGGIADALEKFRQDQEQFLLDQQAFLESGGAGAFPQEPVPPDIHGIIQLQVQQAETLAQLLQQLQQQGLSTANIQAVAGLGGEAAIATATALLADPTLIKAMNKAQRDLANVIQDSADKLEAAAFGDKMVNLGLGFEDFLRHMRRFLAGIRPEEITDKNRELVNALDHLINSINRAAGQVQGGGGGGDGGGGGSDARITDAIHAALRAKQRRNRTLGLT